MALTQAHCCRLLGVSAAATLEETRAAYRRIARRMHPDRVGGDAERFKEITAAYNWLVARQSGRIVDAPKTERRRRQRPDRPTAERRARARHAWEQAKAREARKARDEAEQAKADAEAAGERLRQQQARVKAARQRARAAKRKAREAQRAQAESRWDEEFTDAWEAWCKTAERYHSQRGQGRPADAESKAEGAARAEKGPADSDEARPWTPPAAESGERQRTAEEAAEAASIFERMRKGFRRMARKTALDRVGQDVSLRLPIGPDLLMKGGTRTIAITRNGACPSCAGDGGERCVCGGVGRIKVRETVKITVPPGARSGSKLRLEGKGTAGLDGAADGDLFLLLEPEAIPGFRADGLDLHGRVHIDRALASNGGTVTVDLPGGRVKLNVPKSSRAGDKFRLRGQGIPAWGGATRGDLFLAVAVK